MTLADRIAVLSAGRVQQVGTPLELYERPQNKFVAGFLGSPAMNFLPARVDGRAVRAPGVAVELARPAPRAGEVILGVRPEDLHVEDDARAALRARVEVREPMGADAYLYVATEAGNLVVRTPASRAAREGELVGLSVEPSKVHLFDPRTEVRLAFA
jgi:ABC-type sugar transport system ATPase subunit